MSGISEDERLKLEEERMARTMAGGSHKRVMSRTPAAPGRIRTLAHRRYCSSQARRGPHPGRAVAQGQACTAISPASPLIPASPRPDHRPLGCPRRFRSQDRGAAVRPAYIKLIFCPLIHSGSAAERHREEERRQTEELERRNRERREAEQKQYASGTFKHSA